MVKGFNFDKKKDSIDIEEIIRNGVENFESAKSIQRTLKEKGLTYKYAEFLYDVRKIKSEYNVKEKDIDNQVEKIRYLPETEESRTRKADWFDSVFEEWRKENGLDSKTARKIIKMQKFDSFDTLTNKELGAEYWDYYRKVFE